MIVYRIEAESIGPNEPLASHFATRNEARDVAREYKLWHKEQGKPVGKITITKLVIKTREQLAEALDAAAGFDGNWESGCKPGG